MYNRATAIGIDIGLNSIEVAVVRMGGEVIAVESHALHQNQTRVSLIGKIVDSVQKIRQDVAARGINPMCVGVAAKGFIDHKSGVVLGPDQGIRNWQNVPLTKLINEGTGLPAYADNDANLMTIAEHRFGAARDFKNVIFVALRTGIGGGIIINGKLFRGKNNTGGEIGQMIIKYDGEVGDKGIKGSFEHYASAAAVVRRYSEVKGISQDSTVKRLTCKDIFELSNEGSQEAVTVVEENAALVGIGLANLISIFAPEIIVIGGGMSGAGASYFNMIRKSAFANSLENCRTDVKIVKAESGVKASLLGSAYYSLIRLAGKDL